MSDPHFYRREVDPQSGDSLSLIARWIPHGSIVLELGPGSGYFTRYLSKTLGCTVDAVERDPAMAEHVRPWSRRLWIADLDDWEADAGNAAEKYPFIVLADVLEHLRDPKKILLKLKNLLTENGRFLISVPNVAYAGLVADLLRGDFIYRDEGLLDRTHLHFFTCKTLFSMLEQAGLHVWACEGVSKPLNESEFDARFEKLTSNMRAVLTEMPNAFCYQWVVSAGPNPPPEPVAVPRVSSDAFPIRVFWADSGNDFDYKNSTVAWGKAASLQLQTIRASLPEPVESAIRLRLTDRTGFLRLYSVSLVDEKGRIRRCWDAVQNVDALTQKSADILLREGGIDESGRPFVFALIRGEDSWLELLPSLGGVKIGEVHVELARPMSADYLAAAKGWSQAVDRLRSSLDWADALATERGREIDVCNRKIQALEASLEEAKALHVCERHEKDAQIRYRQSFRWWLKLPIVRLLEWLSQGRKSP